jgi:hypothetical protein
MTNTKISAPLKAADLQFPAASPLCTLKQRIGITDVDITYSRPGVKGRQIFGGLVPYGKLWRAGANQATRITFATAVKLNGTDIAAGAYALLAIPGENEWTIILNKDSEQSGTGKYDEKLDAARIKVKPSTIGHVIENYTIEFDELADESATLNLLWDRTKVSIKLEISYVKELIPQVEAVMSSDQEQKPYFQAALLYLNHGGDLLKADQWVDAAIKERPIYPFYFIKGNIQAKLGDKEAALATAKKTVELASNANDTGFVSRAEAFIASLK